jgi:hypothetical protein
MLSIDLVLLVNKLVKFSPHDLSLLLQYGDLFGCVPVHLMFKCREHLCDLVRVQTDAVCLITV